MVHLVTKLRIVFLLLVLIPQGIIFALAYNTALSADKYFIRIATLALAASLVCALATPGLTAEWLMGKRLAQIRQFCARVKQGKYGELLKLPNESRDGDDEDEVTVLMRDMNWMARQIEIRERDLQQAVDDLWESRKQINEQNKYLVTVNTELTIAQELLKNQAADLENAFRQMQVMAMTDPLTEMANRRCFFDTLEQEVSGPACPHRPISLLALDVDRFKSINDTYGHQAGDKVLQELAGIIQSNIRSSDLAARIGGEEYALLMPDSDSPAAVVVARKIKRAVETHTFMLEDKQVSVTISVGICTLAQPPCRVDVGRLYSFADQALYHSKNSGRNSISIYDPESSTIAKIA